MSCCPIGGSQRHEPPHPLYCACSLIGQGWGRWPLTLSTPQRIEAVEFAQVVAAGRDAHMGDPHHDLKHNLYRFGYVLGKFGITSRGLGVTVHGLRHEALIEEFVVRTGQQPPVRGGGELAPEIEKAARQAVAKLAGHARKRASNAYLGAVMFRKAGREKNGPTE